MKSLVQKVKSLVWVLLVSLWLLPESSQAQQAEVSFQVFYDELAPYGRWFMHPKYGDVWAPDVEGEFTPYLTNGYWTVTQYGNTWVSNYDWGWATFHYGRWFFDGIYGWVWIPGTEWAPAWVVWRNGGGYYGWAAMSPGFNFSVSFSLFNTIPNNYWCFVPQQYVWRPYVYRYCAPRYRNIYIVNNTTYVTHYTVNNVTHNYYTGPSHTEITHVTNRPVVIHNIEQGSRPGRAQVDRDKITLYKPVVGRSENSNMNIKSFTRGEHEIKNDWYHPAKDQGQGNGGNSNGNGSAGGNHNNNGHGNGDQNAPGNSGDHNNAENSENSGKGNSGNNGGSRWGSVSTERNENTHSTTEFKKTSGLGSGNNTNTGRSMFGSSGGSTRSLAPNRSSSSSSNNRSFSQGHSFGGSKSSSNSRSLTSSRSSSSGGGKITPSHSGGSKSRGKN